MEPGGDQRDDDEQSPGRAEEQQKGRRLPESSDLAAAAGGEVTGEGHAVPRRSCRDAACQTEDPLLEPEEPVPAMKRKGLESWEQSPTDPEPEASSSSQKKAKRSTWPGTAGMELPVPGVQAAPAGLVCWRQTRETGKQQEEEDMAVASAAARPLPPLFPPYPTNGTGEDVSAWVLECNMIHELAKKDPLTKLLKNLPTLRKPKDPKTTDAMASSRDKAMVLAVAPFVVSVSSVGPDGKKVICRCTGIVIGWNEANKCARILTSYGILSDIGKLLDPKPKILVRLPNETVSEGQLLFFNEHYKIALLEIMTDFPLQLPSFGSSPKYGQEVFVLARDKEVFLMARHGTILWREEPDHLGRNHHVFLSCILPVNGDGGPVIDQDGNVIGMAFDGYSKYPSILGISTMMICIEMWTKFSRIVRPIHGLHLRTVEFLDVSLREKISHRYKISSGYIVDEVVMDSAAERLGVRRGDVIVSFDQLGIQTLPRLEDLLLSLGWEFLHKRFDSSTMVDLKLEFYDLQQLTHHASCVESSTHEEEEEGEEEGEEEEEECEEEGEEEEEPSQQFATAPAHRRIITLTVGFSDASEL